MLQDKNSMLRAAKHLSDALARALAMAREKPNDAQAELEAACNIVLSVHFSTLAFVDARAAVELLARPDRVLAFAEILEAMGEVEALRGDAAKARRRTLHALEIAREQLRLRPGEARALALVARRQAGVEQP
jgi:acetolactate synthase small subunit